MLQYPIPTYTQGPSSNPGVNQRALSELFKMVEQRKEDGDYSIVVSMLEIYNESVRDLLSVNSAEKLEIKQGPDGIFVPGLIQVQVSGFHDVNEVKYSNCPTLIPRPSLAAFFAAVEKNT